MTGTTEVEAGQKESLRSSQCVSQTGGGKGTTAGAVPYSRSCPALSPARRRIPHSLDRMFL